MTKPKPPATLAQRVAASRARAIEAGGRRLPNGILPAEAAQALDQLRRDGYASSLMGCIAKALIEAAAKHRH